MMSQPPFTEEDWECVIATMSEKAIFSAQLLAGEMPSEIEQVFTHNGLSLFPYSLTDVRSRCSCPDKANPCKHIAAVYYQLGDRFSEDPFLIFQLRGRSKKQILTSLRTARSSAKNSTTTAKTKNKQTTKSTSKTTANKSKSKTETQQELQNFWQTFWKYDEPLDPTLVAIAPPLENKSVLDILGKMPLTAADAEAVNQYLTQVYQNTSQKALIAALNRDE